ncbi:hypothetical protein AVEN_21149-1 [Araneus ventricosus]|uniref:Gustatory receptor n=1 Tax=Araneus ventricosus TaxID=182803 RepID=A0A4Y2I8C5_ARAVE|nr:hypothetical protein AVEN_21149-1 [Araneus ventricosus]
MTRIKASNKTADIPFLIMHELNNAGIQKHLTWLFYTGLVEIHAFELYLISVFIVYGIQHEDFRVAVLFTLLTILSFVLWHFVSHRRKNLFIIIQILKTRKATLKKNLNKKWMRVLNWIAFTVSVSPVFLSVLHVTTTYEIHASDYFVYGYKNMEDRLRFLLCIVGAYAQYVIFVKHPLLIVLSLCVLINASGLLLYQYGRNLKCFISSENSSFKEYLKIVELIHFLNNTLSNLLFIALLIGLLSIYMALEYGLNNASYLTIYTVEASASVLTGILILCSLTVCSSKIPEFMSSIKTTAGFLIDHKLSDSISQKNEFLFLKRIEEKSVVHLSAGGMINIRRRFLLSAFGALFTYGILISGLD